VTPTLKGSSDPLARAYDAALLDLDGVTYRGPEGIPSAAPALLEAREMGMVVVFVTNNASRTPEDVAGHLTSLGIEAKPDEVLTSAQVAATILAERFDPGEKVLVVGGPALRAEVEARGLVVVDTAEDRPAAVVQGWHPDVGWRMLAEGSYAVEAGALFLATNRDSTLPSDRGIAPGNGSLVQTIVTATGVEPESAGKPAPRMFQEAAARVGARAPLVVGDRLDTDIAGACAAGMDSLLVFTGVHGPSEAVAARPGERPSYIGADLGALTEPQPSPEALDGAIRVGGAKARIADGGLVIEGAEEIDRTRAACAVSWEAADRRGEGHVEAPPESGIQ